MNGINSNDDNEDLVFGLFPTEIIVAFNESFSKIMAQSQIVGDGEPNFDNAEKQATLFIERNWKNLYFQFMTKKNMFF